MKCHSRGPPRSGAGTVVAMTTLATTAAVRDLFDKCAGFRPVVDDLRRRHVYQAQYRVVLEGPLDHRIRVRHPFTGGLHEMLCFDSNSYLGLHLHPRVLDATRRALDVMGYGTPSAQLLAGTNRYLCELEERVAAFHGREACLIFPSGYAASIGVATGLLGAGDVVVHDQFTHASLQDGARWSGAHKRSYRHADTADLEAALVASPADGGRLVVTDGVFSMHGRLAPLPELRAIADRHHARLLVDEAHSIGVMGATGRGIEETFGMPGAADVLIGTFSKAPGAVGGYVAGSGDLIDYLRVFARSSLFTASLPAAICAGITEAFRVMQEEPEHRERLWRNACRFWGALRDLGLLVPPLESPIVPVFAGHEHLLQTLSRELFLAGVKCGNVSHPAVPRGDAILRFSVNARHTDEDLDRAADTLATLGRRYGILGLGADEIRAIGASLPPLEAIPGV